MSTLQNIWLTLFNFGPAIFLAINKQWWVGLIAIAATFIISWALVMLVTTKMPPKALMVWAWIKPPIVASVVLVGGWWLF